MLQSAGMKTIGEEEGKSCQLKVFKSEVQSRPGHGIVESGEVLGGHASSSDSGRTYQWGAPRDRSVPAWQYSWRLERAGARLYQDIGIFRIRTRAAKSRRSYLYVDRFNMREDEESFESIECRRWQ